MSKTLIVEGGALKGAFSAGFLAELCRNLRPGHFDAVYASSVGTINATFFVSNQPDTIERTWRNLVHGKQLVNPFNVFRGPILDLGYLIDLFQKKESLLDLDAVFSSRTSLTYVVTDYVSGQARYIEPNRETVFKLMRASTAVPLVSTPIRIGRRMYIDGGMSDPMPIAKAKEDGHENLVVVSNRPVGDSRSKIPLAWALSPFLPARTNRILRQHNEMLKKKEDAIELHKEGLIIIRPLGKLPLRHALDTDEKRLNETIDMGMEAVQEALPLILTT